MLRFGFEGLPGRSGFPAEYGSSRSGAKVRFFPVFEDDMEHREHASFLCRSANPLFETIKKFVLNLNYEKVRDDLWEAKLLNSGDRNN